MVEQDAFAFVFPSVLEKYAGVDETPKAMMMAKFDTGAFSEKDDQLRAILNKLDSMDSAGALTGEDLTAIRRQLSEGQNVVRETVDRLRQSQEENEMLARRRDELESRVAGLETEYEELLGQHTA